MKIAWFTPFHKSSAIGRFSRLVTAELARSVEVDIWHPAAEEIHPTQLRTISCPDDLVLGPEALAAYDVCVYNLGDHLGFHRHIFETARAVPGIVVLHDFVMHHFFAGYYLYDRRDPQEYLRVMERLYGEAGKKVAEPVSTGKAAGVWESDRVIDFPFFEEAIRGACGVVVHSEFLFDAVSKVFPGPVKRLFLAYDRPGGGAAPAARQALQLPDDKLVAVTIGHANSNKRILDVVEAIAKSPKLPGRMIYVVLGLCEGPYGETVRQAIRNYGLEDTVRLLGQVSDEVLSSYLAHADICVNLRCPAMEGASASAIEEMLCGKPVIVTDSGFYRELPSDGVVKIAPGEEVEGLKRAFSQLAGDPALRKRMGARASRFAAEKAPPSKYAAGLLEFSKEIMDAMPILKFIDRAAAHLAAMGVSRDRPLVSTVAETAHELFCAHAPARSE